MIIDRITAEKIETCKSVPKEYLLNLMLARQITKIMATPLSSSIINPIAVATAAATSAVTVTFLPCNPPKITEKERSYYTGPYGALAKFKSPEEEHEWSCRVFKNCSKCNKSLALTNFNGNTASSCPFDKQGYRLRRPECSECTKSANKGKNEATKKAKELGISTKAPEGTPCELCGSTRGIVFDHDHESPKFRGWLCDPCNRSMGVLGDNVDGLMRVLNYLNKNEKRKIVQNPDTLLLSFV